jgi:hypothetical protein
MSTDFRAAQNRSDKSMENITPKYFYDWLMLLKANGLKVAPLEAFKDSRVTHALKPNTLGNVSYGMWDHRAEPNGGSGYLNWDLIERDMARKAVREIAPAPPIPDGNKDWDL